MMCFPDEFIDHADPSDMYAAAKLNAIDIEEKVLSLLDVDILKVKNVKVI
jgi:1-deoxy-D-xylulose-5-phosphate synthase